MPHKCCVPGCKTNYKTGPKLSVFSFPKDVELRRKWLGAICKADFIVTKHSRVCVLHFRENEVEKITTMYDEKTGKILSARLLYPRLIHNAVPSQFPGCQRYLSDSSSTSHECPEKRRNCVENGILNKAIEDNVDKFHTYHNKSSCSNVEKLKNDDEGISKDHLRDVTVSGERHDSSRCGRSKLQNPMLAETEKDIAVPAPMIKCNLQIKQQDFYKRLKVNDAQSLSDNDNCLTNIPIGCTNGSLFWFTRRVSKKVHEKKSAGHLEIDVPHTGDKPHICNVCGKHFCQKSDLIYHHIVTHTDDKPHVCNICGKCFGQKSHLKGHFVTHIGVVSKHIATCTDDKPHICNICDKHFCQKSDLIYHHIVTHTDDKPHICNICDKPFGQKSDLIHHRVITHTGDKPHVCNICGKCFRLKSRLKYHIMTHTGEKPYTCNYCGKSFIQRSNLSIHIARHRDDKPYLCDICGKTFALKSFLKKHIVYTHTGDTPRSKPHSCNFCGKSFIFKSKLKDHIAIHTGDKPHLCNICGKNFRLKSAYKDHMTIHTGDKPHICKFCDKTFRLKTCLKDHIATHSDERPFMCKFCGKGFRQRSILRSHIATHTKPHTCNLCGQSFSLRSYLRKHTATHTKPLICKG